MEPTERELQILKVLWERGESTVREVYEALRDEVPIVQNTVQAFLRIMEGKGFVAHSSRGRSFVYRPLRQRERTSREVLSGVLDDVFDGALDALVVSAFRLKKPTAAELERLRQLLDEHEAKRRRG
ncbi:MAG: BlaI/MecI/CopY family transcriptional regulator [Planctomycetes bacterium]|nr:BlaI/MecI/CopY family transcriptional regulator [Planctomycetota bacterium]